MIVSGIVMVSKRGELEKLKAELEALSWADAHFSDESGRLVVTIEAESIEESMDRLKVLQALPSALMAELAQYCMEDEEGEATEEATFAPAGGSASDTKVAAG